MRAGEPTNDSEGVPSKLAGIPSVDTDIEIGGARDDELDTVLRVMCAAFELPFEVARPIYYADPWFDPQNKRVLRVDGKIVSCLTLVPVRVRIGDSVVDMAGIAGVATLPEMRRRGSAGALIMDAVETLCSRGVPLASLGPFERSYYRRYGWETASTGCRCLVAPKILPAYRERLTVRPVEEGDLPELQRIYAVWSSQGDRTLRALRDSTRWRYLYERVPQTHVFVGEHGVIEGYLLSEVQPGEVSLAPHTAGDGRPPRLHLMELCATTEESRRGLIGHLATRTPCDEIVYECSLLDIKASGLLDVEWASARPADEKAEVGAHMELVPGIMARIVHFPRLMMALRAGWAGFAGTLTLTLRDPMRNDFGFIETSVKVSGNGEGLPAVVITEGRSEGATNSGSEDLERVEGDVHVWTRVAVGHLAGGAACSLGALTATSARAANLCGWLFPQRAAFLPTPDHF